MAGAPPAKARTVLGRGRRGSAAVGVPRRDARHVTAVIVVGIVDRWWVLVPVMIVDFATTFGVVAYIARLLADDGEAPA
jgi:hypothetical protein